jgi:hypothetical protein
MAQLRTLVSFNGSNGNGPQCTLIADAKGDLFGTTFFPGANDDGTVFEIVNNGTVANPSYATTPTALVGFNGNNGVYPGAALIADAKGDLFGTTTGGDPNNASTVFEIANNGTVANPSYATTPVTLVGFNGSNGYGPYAGLFADAKGDLFGTTQTSGANNDSTVFEITNSGFLTNPRPTMSLVASPSSGVETVGQEIALTATFSAPVTISGGIPTLALNDDGTATYDPAATAALSDPTKAVFDYTVAATDRNVSQLVGASTNGATVVDAHGNVPVFTPPITLSCSSATPQPTT